MKVEIDLGDKIVNQFKESYSKDLIHNFDMKEYMRTVDELVHECIKAFMDTELVMKHGGVFLELSKSRK